jgi:NAD(P)-dependent dehydrogenase (short-subunit alcohol dehydrogenase family)
MSKAALNMLTGYQYYQLKDVGAKVWSYCPGYVTTDLGRDRDVRVQQGIDSSETSAQGILEIVEGKRDAEVGTFVARYGQSHGW